LEKLGKHAFYVPGCYQPFAKAIFENGKLTSVKSLNSSRDYQFELFPEPCTSAAKRTALLTSAVILTLFVTAFVFIALGHAYGVPNNLLFAKPVLSFISFKQAIALAIIIGLPTLRTLSVAKTHFQRKLETRVV
jgi:hypothetical protein